ncbi:hypothetical protein HW115_13215 [Verrucomicrobiaceae bacterium N1E253]|uniref:Uncharacterized protein n=1 Tax=Oceaniferula marina TaxID=2748318 RepID=A0A851GN63_9BACT|nr:hypothetical protein [Oceaniferula marina]NWK56575.1 hypothetical protein [Oceaniferula marina]
MKNQAMMEAVDRRCCGSGFALVATISVMVLLVMIALAMLSLSTLELRSSISAKHQSIAKANARMALMIALGELQKYAGQDQRVTANASILDTDPITPEMDGVIYPYTLGVWSTADEDGRYLIQTDDVLNDSGEQFLVDSRVKDEWDRSTEVLRWLVSGEDFDPMDSYGSQMVYLGREGEMDIRIPSTQVGNGHFAWRVSDNAQKYTFNTLNPFADKAKIATQDKSIAESLVPLQTPVDTIDELNGVDPTEEEKAKMLSTMSLALLDGQIVGSGDALQKIKDSLTYMSMGLLTNPQTGGTKKNLSAFIEDYGSYADKGEGFLQGMQKKDPILDRDRFRYTSPTFGVLQDYASLREEVSAGAISSRSEESSPTAIHDTNTAQPAPVTTERIKQGVHPVLTKAAVFPYVAYSKEKEMAVYLFFPRVELYNPYDVTLRGQDYIVSVTARWGSKRYKADLRVIRDGEEKVFSYQGLGTQASANTHAGMPFATDRDFVFRVSCPDIAPGETLLFSPDRSSGSERIANGKAARFYWPSEGVGSNLVLSPESDPEEMTCFWMPCKSGLQAGAEIKNTDNLLSMRIYVPSAHYPCFWDWGNKPHRVAKLYKMNQAFSGHYADERGNNLELLQAIEAYAYLRGNLGIWPSVNRTYQLSSVQDVIGQSIDHEVFRYWWMGYRLMKDSPTQSATAAVGGKDCAFPMLRQYNIRGAYSHFHPIPYQGKAGNRYIFGPYGWTNAHDIFAMPWTGSAGDDALCMSNSYNAAMWDDGKYKMNPYFWNDNSSAMSMPLFEIPKPDVPLLSMTSLRHASMTTKQHAPSYIVGSSSAPIYAPRHASAASMEQYRNAFIRCGKHHNKSMLWEYHNDENTYYENYDAYDFSYEYNHALYDAYFLSGIADFNQAFESKIWNRDETLPNPRLSLSSHEGAAEQGHLTDLHYAARCLYINGSFNVNCTDPEVWSLMLKSMRGARLLTGKGEVADADSTPYPRHSQPVGKAEEPKDSYDQSNWDSFRSLSDYQIEELSLAIVEQVKRRAPFISVSDFINRRLTEAPSDGDLASDPGLAFGPTSEDDESKLGLSGALQAALDDTEINQYAEDLHNSPSPDVTIIGDQSYWRHNGEERMQMAPNFVEQADILTKIDPVISSRGDTFTITVYGDSSENGIVQARAWASATVQRQYAYVDDKGGSPGGKQGDLPETSEEFLTSALNRRFGRTFQLIDFRWLNKSELSDLTTS